MEVKYLTAGQNAASSLVKCDLLDARIEGSRAYTSDTTGGPLPLILHETARLLRKYPVLNAFYDDGNVHYYEP